MKKSFFCLFSLTFLTVSACSPGGGGGINRDIPQPTVGNTTPVTDTPSTEPTRFPSVPGTIEIPGKEKFQEPLTEEPPSPATQVKALQKIMGALKIGDFEYINREYDQGGIKTAAFQADTEFDDLKLDYSTKTVARNSGVVGYEVRDITSINTEERKVILDKLLKQIFIFTIRGNTNRLIENNKNGTSVNDKFSIEIANNMFTYYNGSDDGTVAENSIAKMAQTVDTSNNLSSKTYNAISAGISTARDSSKSDITGLNAAKRQIDTGLYKMIYLSVLESLAEAENFYEKKDLGTARLNMTAAEFMFLGIRDAVKTNNGTDNTFLNKMVSNHRFVLFDYKKFEKLAGYGFGQRATEEMDFAVKNITADNAEAQNAALGAQLYLDIIASPYRNSRYQKSETSELKADAQSFRNAVQSKNAVQAQQLLVKIRNQVSKPAE